MDTKEEQQFQECLQKRIQKVLGDFRKKIQMTSIAYNALIAALKINASRFADSIIFAPNLEKFLASNFQQLDEITDLEDHL